MDLVKRLMSVSLLLLVAANAMAISIKGHVRDKKTHEALIGATIQAEGTTIGTITDADGAFNLEGLNKGVYQLLVKYVGYTSMRISQAQSGKDIIIELEADAQQLNDVVVVARAKLANDMAVLGKQKTSLVVQTGVSSEQISKTQDRDASEVIRRVPGISLIDNKFVMVRGLSQRYNNVWINGGAVPSSEADSRAFSFDLIPSSQLDNMLVIKSNSAEYPADFCGGMVLVQTKDVPSKNTFSINAGFTPNGQDFYKAKGSNTDFLGFDGGLRNLDGGIHAQLNADAGMPDNAANLLGNGLNNDWTVTKHNPLADFSFGASLSHRWNYDNASCLALLASLNYSSNHVSIENMVNSLYGCYDEQKGESSYLRKSTDNQYSANVRVGAMANITYLFPSGNDRIEWKNIFNQLGKERYTLREGLSAQSDQEKSAEYYYSSRSVYNTQLTGTHSHGGYDIDWSLGYAYANRNQPDRRRYLINDALEYGVMALSSSNDLSREFTYLTENIYSAGVNIKKQVELADNFAPTFKLGGYGEYRTRDYAARTFIYNWDQSSNSLPSNFRYMDIANELMQDSNYGSDKLYLLEQVKWRNNYGGNNTLGAAYFSANIPVNDKFNILAGVRYENNKMELISNTRDYEKSPSSTFYRTNDFFPSVNTVYKFNEQHQLRASYGRSINRPEFREVSSSVYYDFELASNVQGNTSLKSCYINNADIRYEFYPNSNAGETISFAVFYKNFTNPIEWTYTVTGGTDLTYSYKNAKSADSYGVELDVRKDLSFIGLKGLSWTFNGSLIKSKVHFEEGSSEEDRQMQGQSPYLINTGFFYAFDQKNKNSWNFAVLYNRIGKRIIGVGRSVGTVGGEDTANIPNSYEMPRNAVDLSAKYKLNKGWEFKLAVNDLINEKITCQQLENVTYDGKKTEVKEITKQYRPRRTATLSVGYTF